MRVSLPDLLIAEGVRTLTDVHAMLSAVPENSLVVIDSMDTLPIGAGRRLTAGVQGVYPALVALGERSGPLVQNGVSVLLLSQMRYTPKVNAVTSSAGGMVSALTAALSVKTVRRETKFGEKQWTTLNVHNTKHTSWPPGGAGVMYMHPELGICPEMELLQEARERWGSKWRSKLSDVTGISLPNGYVAGAQYLRDNPAQFDDLWRLLWRKRK